MAGIGLILAAPESGQDGVDEAGAEGVVQRGAGQQQPVEDGPGQELVDQADLGAGAQVAAGDAAA